MQSKWCPGRHVIFARDPLRSYFDEPQKHEIHFLYLHFLQPFYALFSSFLSKVCKLHGTKCYLPTHLAIILHSTAVVMTWCQSNVSTTNEDVCLPVTSLNDNVTWSFDVHRCINLVSLKSVHLRKVCDNGSIIWWVKKSNVNKYETIRMFSNYTIEQELQWKRYTCVGIAPSTFPTIKLCSRLE